MSTFFWYHMRLIIIDYVEQAIKFYCGILLINTPSYLKSRIGIGFKTFYAKLNKRNNIHYNI